MKRGIPLLLEMLTYKRPAFSTTDDLFIRRFITPTGARPDGKGNYILRIGDAPILWASHTDTVHRSEGRQRLRVRSGVATVRHPGKMPANWRECLGADDTTGVWLMLEMIRAGVPGLYVFHRAEEIGCGGSEYIVSRTPELLDGILYAISFDRRGYDSIVTHQLGFRTASDLFAWSLSDAIGLRMIPDPTGSFTDSEQYAHIVPECTNISVGYLDQHTSRESQDLAFARQLRDRMVRFDWTRLVVDREPALPDYGNWSDDDVVWEYSPDDTPPEDEVECPMCDHPVAAGQTWPFGGTEVCGDCWAVLVD